MACLSTNCFQITINEKKKPKTGNWVTIKDIIIHPSSTVTESNLNWTKTKINILLRPTPFHVSMDFSLCLCQLSIHFDNHRQHTKKKGKKSHKKKEEENQEETSQFRPSSTIDAGGIPLRYSKLQLAALAQPSFSYANVFLIKCEQQAGGVRWMQERSLCLAFIKPSHQRFRIHVPQYSINIKETAA